MVITRLPIFSGVSRDGFIRKWHPRAEHGPLTKCAKVVDLRCGESQGSILERSAVILIDGRIPDSSQNKSQPSDVCRNSKFSNSGLPQNTVFIADSPCW